MLLYLFFVCTIFFAKSGLLTPCHRFGPTFTNIFVLTHATPRAFRKGCCVGAGMHRYVYLIALLLAFACFHFSCAQQ